jgi:hypothetical protein
VGSPSFFVCRCGGDVIKRCWKFKAAATAARFDEPEPAATNFNGNVKGNVKHARLKEKSGGRYKVKSLASVESSGRRWCA